MRIKNWKLYFLFFIVFLLVGVLITLPTIFNIYNQVPGREMDVYNYMWNVDTFWHELFKLRNPLTTNRIFYPFGTPLLLHTYAPFVSLPGFFFLNTLPLYMNLVIIAFFGVAGISMFALVYYLTKHKFASFIAGLTFCASPIMVSYVESQHYYFLISASMIPLLILFTLRFIRLNKMIFAFLSAILFWVLFFTDYYMAVLSLVIFVITVLWNWKKIATKLNTKTRKNLVYVFTLLVVIPTILLGNFISKSGPLKATSIQENYYPKLCNADMLRLVLPSHLNPLLGGISQQIQRSYRLDFNYDTPSIYLGLSLVLFSVYWVLKRRTNVLLLFGTIGIVSLFISLGPEFKWGGKVLYQGITPYTFFSKVPFMHLIDCPQRFVSGIQLSIAAIIGIAVSEIFSKSKNIKLLTTIIIGAVVLEYSTAGLPTTTITTPQVYEVIKKSHDEKTVLEIPSGISESKGAFGYDWSINALHVKQLYWQTTHDKPMVGGYTSRLSKEKYDIYKSEPILSDIFAFSSPNGVWKEKEYSDKEIKIFLQKFNIGYIVLSPNSRQTKFESMIDNIFTKYIESKINVDGFVLYRLNKYSP